MILIEINNKFLKQVVINISSVKYIPPMISRYSSQSKIFSSRIQFTPLGNVKLSVELR